MACTVTGRKRRIEVLAALDLDQAAAELGELAPACAAHRPDARQPVVQDRISPPAPRASRRCRVRWRR
jgi:hypothetical protein